MPGRILVGTSSWADPGFVKEWYPPRMAAKERLPWYAQHFQAVELNSSFYAIPDRNTVHGWVEATPDDFVFDVKVHRALSRHSAPLDSLPPDMREQVKTNQRGRVLLTPELEEALAARLVEETAPLAEAGKLGAFLVQLTPGVLTGQARARGARRPGPLALVAPGGRGAAPSRMGVGEAHRSDAGLVLREGRRFVCVDAPPGEHVPIMPPITAATRDDLAYFRIHGRDTEGYMNGKTVAERFGWRYEDEELEEIGERVRTLAESAGDVHVMFNNNRGDDAPTAAQRFRALLGQEPRGEEQLRLG